MRITLVAPGLLALPSEALAQATSLSQLAAIAGVHDAPGLDEALLADLGCEAQPAPLAAAGAGIDVGTTWVVRADPVSMIVGREDVRLAGLVDDLDEAERSALLALLDGHFAGDGLAFFAPRADAFFASIATPQQVRTAAIEAVGNRPLRECIPAGPDAPRWRRWLTEAQMLLHDHALAQRAGLPVNALWFAGGGVLPNASSIPAFDAYAAAGRHGDVVRGLVRVGERRARPITPLPEALTKSASGHVVSALSALRSPVDLATLVRDFVTPAVDALYRGDASAVKLIASGNGIMASWSAQRPSWTARLRRKQSRFVAPETLDRR
jgi:hypothetical protein